MHLLISILLFIIAAVSAALGGDSSGLELIASCVGTILAILIIGAVVSVAGTVGVISAALVIVLIAATLSKQ